MKLDDLLIEASRLGSVGVVSACIAEGANANAVNAEKETALHLAADGGHDHVVQKLLDAGAVVDSKDLRKEFTALHRASAHGHTDIVNRLIERGANLNAKDIDFSTPLHHAAYNSQLHVLERLLEAGAETEAKTRRGLTPLHWVNMHGADKPIVDRLKQARVKSVEQSMEQSR